MRLLVFGPGYSARAAMATLRPRCDWIAASARNEAGVAALQAAAVRPIKFGEAYGGDVRSAVLEATHILVSVPPSEGGDPVLEQVSSAFGEATGLRSVVYLSTVGVYGDHGGGWVDEETIPEPKSERSRARLAAEAAWKDLAAEAGWPLTILRLSGIYGPGRNPLANLAAGTARRIVKPGQVFNRVHVDDIASAIGAAFDGESGGIFNISDDLPAPPQDVITFAADLMGIEAPPDLPFETAELSPMARSFYGENKRVRNSRMKRDLGVELAYPTYRDGIRALWVAGEGRTQ